MRQLSPRVGEIQTTWHGGAVNGPVRAGRPYLVGEEGPELIVPKPSGTVVPNHALSYQPLGKVPARPTSPAASSSILRLFPLAFSNHDPIRYL